MTTPPSLDQVHPSGSPAGPDLQDLARLRTAVQGAVFTPDDAAYPAAASSWVLNLPHAPRLVVLPESATDVARAVAFARDHELPVAVQATGHGVSVPCVDGMLINTSRMQGLTIDPATRRARVEAGVKWSSVIPPAHEHGLAPLSGSTSDVGVVGYTLGGGTGWLARKYGRAADHVLAADLVTANGELLHVTRESHPDLFWALHGGSSNFGIVTALEFELLPIAQVYGGSVIYPLELAQQVFPAFSAWTATLPAEITASISIMRFPPLPMVPPPLQGAACVIVRACAVGDLAAGEATIAPMRKLGTPIIDTFDTMPFAAIDAISMDPVDPMPATDGTLMLPDLSEEAIANLLAVAGTGIETPLLLIDIRYLAGNGTQPSGGMQPPDAAFSLYAVGITPDPASALAVNGALDGLATALAPYAADQVLFNFLGGRDISEERTRAAFTAADYHRLQGIKATYDPGNCFRFNHNISPRAAG